MVNYNSFIKLAIFSLEFTTSIFNFAKKIIKTMEKQTVITKTIFRNNISYLQYDLPKLQAKTSFFDILSLKDGDKKYPEVQQKIHCQNFFSIFWFYKGGAFIRLISRTIK